MVTAPGLKNLWVAASDGDLDRVKELVAAGATPNDKDEHSYSPMHAAASYAHLDMLAYLVGAGGDVNLSDDDGETPLFTCEDVDAACWLVEHGADATHRNGEGQTAAETLAEDWPAVAAYLRGVTGVADPAAAAAAAAADVSQLAVEQYTAAQTDDLLAQARAIMEQAERDGVDPDARLRDVVARAVRQGFSYGGELGAARAGPHPDADAARTPDEHKRARPE